MSGGAFGVATQLIFAASRGGLLVAGVTQGQSQFQRGSFGKAAPILFLCRRAYC